MSDSIFYRMKAKSLINKFSSGTVSVMQKLPVLEILKSKLYQKVKDRQLVAIIKSKFANKIISQIIYESIASKGLSKNMEELLRYENSKTKESDPFVLEFLKKDYSAAEESWKSLTGKIDNKERDFSSHWTGISGGNYDNSVSKIHKIYYSFRFSRGNLQNGVILFGNTTISILKLLHSELQLGNIRYFSLKIPTDFVTALSHTDILVIHFSCKEDLDYIESKINEVVLSVNREAKDGSFEKNFKMFDSKSDFGEFKGGLDRMSFSLRPGHGNDVVSSDSNDFSELLSRKMTSESGKYFETLMGIAEYIDNDDKILDEDVRIADAFSILSSFFSMAISNEISFWQDLTYEEKKKELESYGIMPKLKL